MTKGQGRLGADDQGPSPHLDQVALGPHDVHPQPMLLPPHDPTLKRLLAEQRLETATGTYIQKRTVLILASPL